MRKNITLVLLSLLFLCSLAFPAAAAPVPSVAVTCTAFSGGSTTVSVSFQNIPQDNPVEYAQILLTCRSGQHNIVSNSMAAAVTGDVLLTQQFNTAVDSLQVLIEPKVNTFPGIQNGKVFSFSVKQAGSQQADPNFDLFAILILKDGTEQEINARITAHSPSTPSTQPTQSSQTVPPSSSQSTPSTSQTAPSTAPSTQSTVPTTAPVPQGNTPQNGIDSTRMFILLFVMVAAMVSAACVLIVYSRKPKKK